MYTLAQGIIQVTGLTNLSDFNFVHYLILQLRKRWYTFMATLPNDRKVDVFNENILGRVYNGKSMAAPANLVTTFVADNIHWAKQRVMIRMAQRFFSDGSWREHITFSRTSSVGAVDNSTEDEDDPNSEQEN